MTAAWTRESWRTKPIVQVPEYRNQDALKLAEQRLRAFSAAGLCR